MLNASAQEEADSNYGSDFDEEGEAELRELLDAIDVGSAEPLARPRAQDEDANPTVAQGAASSVSPRARVVSFRGGGQSRRGDHGVAGPAELDIVPPGPEAPPYDESPGRIRWEGREKNAAPEDSRSPLERFRTAPRKPFSVTDFVSPAWCELQYWYNLVNYGRVKQTSAMKRGSEVHSVLEEQVHQTVQVDVQTREDAFGLRIWNVVQGLRTLRVTGMTRELELWGTVDGQVINGVIDELSFTCTDPKLEDLITKLEDKEEPKQQVPADQTSISQYFATQGEDAPPSQSRATARRARPQSKIYLTDVKTRNSRTLPNQIAMRPTEMQLMLYSRLLRDMASNNVDPAVIFGRYNLNASHQFSDSLIAQLSAIDFNLSSQATEDSYAPVESKTDTVMELLTHNSLTELWSLLAEEFRKTMPSGAENISRVLRAEFRSPKDGAVIGVKTFPYSDERISNHVADELRWWKGEREARGVDVEEAFKCRTCQFAENCSWRLSKIEDAVSASRVQSFTRKVSPG